MLLIKIARDDMQYNLSLQDITDTGKLRFLHQFGCLDERNVPLNLRQPILISDVRLVPEDVRTRITIYGIVFVFAIVLRHRVSPNNVR